MTFGLLAFACFVANAVDILVALLFLINLLKSLTNSVTGCIIALMNQNKTKHIYKGVLKMDYIINDELPQMVNNFNEYMLSGATHKSPKTVESYTQTLGNFFKFLKYWTNFDASESGKRQNTLHNQLTEEVELHL